MSDARVARLFRAARFFAVVSSFVVAGCSAEAAPDDALGTTEGALGEAATLRFDADFGERLTGDLAKGKKVRVVYDAARLPQCRGEQGGIPQWSITGNWRIGSGPVKSFTAAGLNAGDPQGTTLELDGSGDLQLWFESTDRWGCHAFDSDFGKNYHFAVRPAESDPGWMGNARYAIDRRTCEGGKVCDASLRPVPAEIVYDAWARQRAAVRVLTFEVWKQGVTDFDNGDLWKQLDVQVHSRVAGTTAFTSKYVSFDRRAGNNARYAVDLTALDPLDGVVLVQDPKDCPAFPLTPAPNTNGAYVQATVELFVTVNGVELRPDSGGLFRVTYLQQTDRYPACPK